MTAERDDEILRLMEDEKLSARSVARRLGISDSTVSRAWRRAYDRRQLLPTTDCCEHDLVIDEVISCDLPDGHEGPHQTEIGSEPWRRHGPTYWIRWQYDDQEG